ncbi:MAG TPA: SprT family zinc-dependent metalloprotease [Gammaproteobacteria bacterium]|nr:SprT family zinc-dependent metalloprotease [Gammaproteobacteria bacterium]
MTERHQTMADLPEYTVRESRRAKRARLTVSPAGRVEVVIPRGFPRREVPALVAANRQWLERALERVRSRQAQRPDLHGGLPERVHLPALERAWEVEYAESVSGRARIREGDGRTLRVLAPDPPAARQALCAWLHRVAKAHLPPWLKAVGGQHGLEPARVTIRCQATRWGSCSSRGAISLNRNLLFLGADEVRYLFLHELAHTVHLNHSPEFWGLLARLEPEYRVLDQRLRGATGQVPAWALPDRLLPADFFA